MKAILLTLSTTFAGIGDRAGEIMRGLNFFSNAEPASELSGRYVDKRMDNDRKAVAVASLHETGLPGRWEVCLMMCGCKWQGS